MWPAPSLYLDLTHQTPFPRRIPFATAQIVTSGLFERELYLLVAAFFAHRVRHLIRRCPRVTPGSSWPGIEVWPAPFSPSDNSATEPSRATKLSRRSNRDIGPVLFSGPRLRDAYPRVGISIAVAGMIAVPWVR